MTVAKDLVRMLDAYTRWADARVLDAAAAGGPEAWTKDVGGSFGSLRNTAVHLVSAQWIWLSRWQGKTPAGMWKPEEIDGPAALRPRWAEVARDRAAFLEAQTDGTLARDLRYVTTEGTSYANPLGELVLHMVNHSTYHRGQIAALLRNLGAKAPSTDLVAWIRAGKPEEKP